MINLIKKMIGMQGLIAKPTLCAMVCAISGVFLAPKAMAQARGFRSHRLPESRNGSP